MAKKPKETEEHEELETEETEEVDETEETDEEEEEETSPAKKPAKRINIMDSKYAAEPPKKEKKARFENKLDFSPVIEAINGLGNSLKEKKPKKETPKEESKGFMEVLGDW